MRNKRCHYYDSRGRPRILQRTGKPISDYGCKCRHNFAHPEDPEWASLPPVPAPAFLLPSPSPPPLIAPAINNPVKEDNEKALLTLVELKSDYEMHSTKYRKLQQLLDNTALLSPQHSGKKWSRSQLLVRRDAAEKEMKAAYVRFQEWERNTSSKFQNVENTSSPLESETLILRNLLQELQLKLVEAESLKNEVERNFKKASVEQAARMDTDGDMIMDSASSSLKHKQSSPPVLVPPQTQKLIHLQSMLDKASNEVASLESNVATQEEVVRDIIQNSAQADVTSLKIINVVDGAENLDNELSELAEITTEIIAEDDMLKLDCRNLQKEWEDQEEELQKLVRHLDELRHQQEQDENDLTTISNTLTTYMERPLSPPPSPFIPEDVITDLEEQITPLIRNAIKPLVENLRSELTQELLKHESEVFRTLSPIYSTTRQAIDSISNATA